MTRIHPCSEGFQDENMVRPLECNFQCARSLNPDGFPAGRGSLQLLCRYQKELLASVMSFETIQHQNASRAYPRQISPTIVLL